MVWVIVGLGVLLGTAWMVALPPAGCVCTGNDGREGRAAARGDLVETVAAPGEIQPQKKVQISAKVAAPIVLLPHKEGDPIKKGELLVRLDNKDLMAVKRQVVAQREAQEQQIEVARQRIEGQEASIRVSGNVGGSEAGFRAEQIAGGHTRCEPIGAGHGPIQIRRTARADRFSREKPHCRQDQPQGDGCAAPGRSKAQVDKADQDISYTEIVSPIDGTMTVLKAEEGEMVMTGTMNNAGTMILEVADLKTMLMVAHLDESQIDPVKVGQHAVVRIGAFRDVAFDGEVESVGESRTTDTLDQTKYFQIKVRLLDLKGRRVRSG